MIGWYVHHVGVGHLHRARSIMAAGSEEVTVLSSLRRPADWDGEWIELARDDADPAPLDVDAGGRLHWVPEHDPGLRSRMAAISAWICRARPRVFVVDISVEVALLVRLHGVPVVTVALPGDRGDAAHALGYDVARLILACWPDDTDGIVRGLTAVASARLRPIGAISRFGRRADDPDPQPRTVLVLSGAGGSDLDPGRIDAARSATPGWRWTVLDGTPETWVADPWPLIVGADVIVTHAGQNAIADVAAARRPAIVIPQRRPHDEQRSTARALAAEGYPVVVLPEFPADGWAELLERARHLDGADWQRWNDGRGAARAAQLIAAAASEARG